MSTSGFLTVKILGRTENKQVQRELLMNNFLRERCRSRYISTIEDSFTIPHHLAESEPKYRDVRFDVIAYPPAGTDLQRIQTDSVRRNSRLPLSIKMRVKCVREIVRGVTELHSLGIVHAGN